jgi:hypothetical protein
MGHRSLLFAALGALALLGATACRKELPAPWAAMGFPLASGELLPGADENGFVVTYRGMGQQADLFREFQSALERGGYRFERNGSSHDPTAKSLSAILSKGAGRVLLAVSGERPVQVKVTTNVD